MVALARELAKTGVNSSSSCQLAGLHLKNLLSSRDSALNCERKSRWLKIVDIVTRNEVKRVCLSALHSPYTSAAHAAAQVVAKLGAIEIPVRQWPELLDDLVSNMHVAEDPNSDLVKTVTLETLGYICDDLEEDVVAHDDTNKILTAIVDGLREDRTQSVRVAAAQALLNSLIFTRHNFEVEEERDMIMRVVCSATKSPDERLRTVAFESLCRIATLFYDKLGPYMNVLFTLSLEVIQHDNSEQATMMAIEFWSTLCEEELELVEEALHEVNSGTQHRKCARYVQQAAGHVVPVLLTSTLTRQVEHADVDTWNVAAAGAVCLSLVAQTVGDHVVPYVLQFIERHILAPDWRSREASIMAFGQILDGPDHDTLAVPVAKALPVIIQSLTDENASVKDTAAWTLARICEFHAQRIPPDLLQRLVESLLAALQDTACVSAQACFAVHNLAAACEKSNARSDSAQLRLGVSQQTTNPLSPFFQTLVTQLLNVSERTDWQEHNLRSQAYEAINMLIHNHAADTRHVVLDVFRHMLQRLHSSLSMQAMSQDERVHRDQLQSMLCSVIQVTIRVVDSRDVLSFSDHVIMLLLQVLRNQNALASEEAFLTIGALASCIESDFEKYMPDLAPYLLQGLRNYADWQVCNAAVGTTGDLCRALEEKIFSYCDDIVQCLLEDLQNPELNRQVKPNVLSCFGDIALAIGGSFTKYLDITLQMLDQAGLTKVQEEDEELIEYLGVLREGVLEAYTGIVQGLKDGGKTAVLTGVSTSCHNTSLAKIFTFLDLIARDADENKCEDSVIKHSIGLIGDLADITPKGPASDFFKSPCVVVLMRSKCDTSMYKYARAKIDENHG
mmetsp:Transcript_4795/g.15000  ORF Transcript_4795/g.15000 Transcript_4795/m.15000 type:complete len:845 (-) Transcript_4795:709-3243(-)